MGEGDGDVGEYDGGVGVDRGDDDGPEQHSGATANEGERAPFLFFLFLELLPRWEKGLPYGPWFPWRGRGESPSEIGSISLFLRSLILPLHRFFNIRRSITPIGVNL